MRQSFLRSLRAYPWGQQALCLLPSVLLLFGLTVCIGSGDAVTLYFKEAKANHPFVTGVMRGLTNWTNIAFYVVYTALLGLGLLGRNKALVRFVLVFAAVQFFVSAILVQITKISLGRARPLPALEGNGWSPFSLKGSFHSFPSGHTSEISGAAFPLANRYKRARLSLFLGLIVALIGFTRIYLCMHYISDVAGGLAAGVLAGFLTHHLCSREQP